MKYLKYIFGLLSIALLVLMVLMSRDSGVNCDEVLHYNHSLAVLKFYSTHGKDTSVLDTPVSHLKYYGQSYDNISSLITSLTGIDDVYGFRHLMSSLAGWLAIIVTAMFAVWLSGYEAGIAVILLFMISPTFLGHAQNNLKDIPFALAYISGTWFIFRFLRKGRPKVIDMLMLSLSMAFCLSIRPGGLILTCYLLLFYIIVFGTRLIREGKDVLSEALQKGLMIVAISAVAFFAGILFWPFALLDPARNVLESYRVMLHYPDTFRQIFEGVAEYSDYMPWYYLPKSMMITIPIVVSAGVILYIFYSSKILRDEKSIFHILLLFTILFPVVLVLTERSNLYSSWRHFLFIYPGIVLIASIGITYLFRVLRKKLLKSVLVLSLVLLSIHPALYMIKNHRYAYIYYNQLVGGISGALGNYETDYYFVSQRESAEWLSAYLEKQGLKDSVTVASNFSVEWFFRKQPLVKNEYVRFEERSMYKWDYAIITNRYIPPYQLKNGIWPPHDALHTVYVDGVPVSIVIKQKSPSSYLGWQALRSGRTEEAINYFSSAVKADSTDDMIFYNFAVALSRKGLRHEADSILKKSLALNPGSDLALMFSGDLKSSEGKKEEAVKFYEKAVSSNRKYPEAYMSLARLVEESDKIKAREILRDCIEANPESAEAVKMLGDTYSESDPDIAEKYYKMAKTIK